MGLFLNPFRAPKSLPILTSSKVVSKKGFPVVKALSPKSLEFRFSWRKKKKWCMYMTKAIMPSWDCSSGIYLHRLITAINTLLGPWCRCGSKGCRRPLRLSLTRTHTQSVIRAIGVLHTACKDEVSTKPFDLTAVVHFAFCDVIMYLYEYHSAPFFIFLRIRFWERYR